MTAREKEIYRLKKLRPRDRFLRFSVIIFLLIVVISWLVGGFSVKEVFSPQRIENITRFLGEIQPQPLRQSTSGFSDVIGWINDILSDRGYEASITTLAIAIASIVLAGLVGMILAFFAARNLAAPDPYLPCGKIPIHKWRILWRACVFLVRAVLVFFRAIPEYIWAFLFLAMIGPQAWPAVLALALHNMGILGRLNAEVIENLEPGVPAAMRGIGASRRQISLLGIFPLAMPRFLLYFFYRWETCVREATVLGLLGFASLGYWIQDARARDHYDEMLLLVMLSAVLVLVGDFVSTITRYFVRHAG